MNIPGLKYIFMLFILGCLISETTAQPGEIKETLKLTDHPRLFLLNNDIPGLKEKIASEKILREAHELIIGESEKIIAQPLLNRNQIGRRILHTSREAICRVLFLSYSYRMTGNTSYALRAKSEMLNLAAFDDWNPTHFLDVAEMTMAMSVGYDWLFDLLSEKERKVISDAILQKGLQPSFESKFSKWLENTNNWNQVCNGGISAGAVALFDAYPAQCAALLNRAITSLPHSLQEYANDGAYPEGYHYWAYGTTYNVLLLAMLEQNFGSDFGLKNFPGFMNTASFMQQMEGCFLESNDKSYPLCFNYADGGQNSSVNPAMFWFAAQNRQPELLYAEKRKLEADLSSDPSELAKERFLPFLIIWSKNIDFLEVTIPQKKMYVANGNTEIAVMRTSWNNDNGIYLGVKGGTPSASHQHMDGGSFVMEANGIRWALDFGNQEYNSLESKGIDLWNRSQESQRWDVFRYRNSSHNTLTVNGGKQLVSGNAIITKLSDTENNMAVSVQMTPLYKNELDSLERTVALIESKRVQVTDYVKTGVKKVSVHWNMLTAATPEIVDDHTIILSSGKKKLVVKIQGEGKAVILSTQSPNDYDAPNP
jgi:hypothetical protein